MKKKHNCLIIGTWGDDGATLMLTMDSSLTDSAQLLAKANQILHTFLIEECSMEEDDLSMAAWITHVVRMVPGSVGDFEEMVVYAAEEPA